MGFADLLEAENPRRLIPVAALSWRAITVRRPSLPYSLIRYGAAYQV